MNYYYGLNRKEIKKEEAEYISEIVEKVEDIVLDIIQETVIEARNNKVFDSKNIFKELDEAYKEDYDEIMTIVVERFMNNLSEEFNKIYTLDKEAGNKV